MTYERITQSTRAILRRLPLDMSTESVARAYNIDPLIVELERPKPQKTMIGHRPDEEPIPGNSAHRDAMRAGSERLLAAMQRAYPERYA